MGKLLDGAFAPHELSQKKGTKFEVLTQIQTQRNKLQRSVKKTDVRAHRPQGTQARCNRKNKAQGRHSPCVLAYPHALVLGHSHQPVLEEDMNQGHGFHFAFAGLDIGNHTVPRDALL